MNTTVNMYYTEDNGFSMDGDGNPTTTVTFMWELAETQQKVEIVYWRQMDGDAIEDMEVSIGRKLFRYLSTQVGLGDSVPTAIRNIYGKIIYNNI
jgi:hypothetical protein